MSFDPEGENAFDDPALAGLATALHELGDGPPPTWEDELAALMESPARRRLRRTGVVGLVTGGLLAASVGAAAADALPDPAQRLVSGLVSRLTPFDLPHPDDRPDEPGPRRDPDSRDDSHRSPGPERDDSSPEPVDGTVLPDPQPTPDGDDGGEPDEVTDGPEDEVQDDSQDDSQDDGSDDGQDEGGQQHDHDGDSHDGDGQGDQQDEAGQGDGDQAGEDQSDEDQSDEDQADEDQADEDQSGEDGDKDGEKDEGSGSDAGD